MTKHLILSILLIISFNMFSQDVFGVWETIDKETGKPSSHIKIYKGKDGKAYGRIIKIHDPKAQNDVCTKCEGDKKNQPTLNMVIIEGLSKDGDEYNNGKILDPTEGKIYDCAIWIEGEELKLRGYWG